MVVCFLSFGPFLRRKIIDFCVIFSYQWKVESTTEVTCNMKVTFNNNSGTGFQSYVQEMKASKTSSMPLMTK